jgi:hypothetical protein
MRSIASTFQGWEISLRNLSQIGSQAGSHTPGNLPNVYLFLMFWAEIMGIEPKKVLPASRSGFIHALVFQRVRKMGCMRLKAAARNGCFSAWAPQILDAAEASGLFLYL